MMFLSKLGISCEQIVSSGDNLELFSILQAVSRLIPRKLSFVSRCHILDSEGCLAYAQPLIIRILY